MADSIAEKPDVPVPRKVFVRTLVGIVGAGYAGAVGYPIYRYLSTPARREASAPAVTEVALPEASMPKPGTALSFMFGNRPALLIHHHDGSVVCFDAVCTHLGCTVQFQPKENRIFCPCHGGKYDMATGKNTGGPPPKPLRQHNVEQRDGQIIVTRV
ncbi:MAG: Rieske (2Fe-2S) protein [Candidatus Hydrogenedentes bacterium]|nr:Rieske (2Fe-2S) protein [Candidatus Hydrogenedentota bacterium]